MSFIEDVLKRNRVQKLRTVFKSSDTKDLTKRYKKIFIGIIVFGIVSIVITIALVLLLIRWLWNVGTDTVATNPTVSSVVESTKESVQSILPTVPSGAQDFLQNGVVDEQKLKETFESLPATTQQVWKNALETSINEQFTTATGTTLQQLQQLKDIVLGL